MTPSEIQRTAYSFYFRSNPLCPSCKSDQADAIHDDVYTAPFKDFHGGECSVRKCGFCGAEWSYQTVSQFRRGHTEKYTHERIKKLFEAGHLPYKLFKEAGLDRDCHTIRMNEGSSLRIGVPKGYPEEIQWQCKELTELYTLPDKRGQGWAHKLMQEVCQEADEYRISLLLHVKPYEVLDSDTEKADSKRLQTFYGRYGFVVFQTEPAVLMCRTPKKLE